MLSLLYKFTGSIPGFLLLSFFFRLFVYVFFLVWFYNADLYVYDLSWSLCDLFINVYSVCQGLIPEYPSLSVPICKLNDPLNILLRSVPGNCCLNPCDDSAACVNDTSPDGYTCIPKEQQQCFSNSKQHSLAIPNNTFKPKLIKAIIRSVMYSAKVPSSWTT